MRQDSWKLSVFGRARAALGSSSLGLVLAALGCTASACTDHEASPGFPDADASSPDGTPYQAATAGAAKPAPGKPADTSHNNNVQDAGGSKGGSGAQVPGSDAGHVAEAAGHAAGGSTAVGGHAGHGGGSDSAGSGGAGASENAGGAVGHAGHGGQGGDAAGGEASAAGMAGSAMAGAGSGSTENKVAMRVLTVGLEAPWEVAWGPDDQLWITERIGKRVVRVEPTHGQRTVALTVADAHQSAGQDGVLGMALDPRLGQGAGHDYVYLAYTYDADPGDGLTRRTKLVRYSYDFASETLGSPLTLISGLPASNDHNSGRLVYGPDGRLYYTLGDQGKNQFENTCLEIRAQQLPTQSQVDGSDWSNYEGKVLRLQLDGSIPSDNPVIGGVRSHVYSYGHRNAQGLVFGPDGKLYNAEHGPKTDDEINVIVAGKNYGWPFVAGFRDDMAYGYANWSASSPTPCASLSYTDYQVPTGVPIQRETDWNHPDFRSPLMTFYTVDDDFNFMDPACAGSGAEYVCWPTVAPSSIDFYVAGDDGLTAWGRSLLVTSLKAGSVFRVQLDPDGETTVGTPQKLFKTTNRYRDLAIAPDKHTFYVITDSDGPTSGPMRGTAPALDNPGAVLEFSYTP